MSKKALMVLGMDRSGTSAMAGMMHRLGVPLGDQLIPGDDMNPRGYYEHREIGRIHQEVLAVVGSYHGDFLPWSDNWWNHRRLEPHTRRLAKILERDFSGCALWGLKDPRLCRLFPWWQRLCNDLDVSMRVIYIFRSPVEVVLSLQRAGYSINESFLWWLAYNRDAEKNSRGERRAVVEYRDLLANWRAVARKISMELEIEWPTPPAAMGAEMDDFIWRDTDTHSHKKDPERIESHGDRRALYLSKRLYTRLQEMPYQTLDSLHEEVQMFLEQCIGWRRALQVGSST